MHENVLLQKLSNQNGGIIWSTTHDDQSSYQLWNLSDQQPQRSCVHKVKFDVRTNEQTEKHDIKIIYLWTIGR